MTTKKLSKIDDPTIINIEVSLFCGDNLVLRDTTWLKNIEDLVELFNHLEKNDQFIHRLIHLSRSMSAIV